MRKDEKKTHTFPLSIVSNIFMVIVLTFVLPFSIDLHDIVLRFNHAPTKGHENDVGSKTTIRVVNSQVSVHHVINFRIFSTFDQKMKTCANLMLFCRWLVKKSSISFMRRFLRMFRLPLGIQAHTMEHYTIGKLSLIFCHSFSMFDLQFDFHSIFFLFVSIQFTKKTGLLSPIFSCSKIISVLWNGDQMRNFTFWIPVRYGICGRRCIFIQASKYARIHHLPVS